MTRRNAKILYIDDDPGLARLVQKTLQSQGFEVEFALSLGLLDYCSCRRRTSMSSA